MGDLTRREVIKAGAVAGAALAVGTPRGGLAAMQSKFKLNYAPHFGMFRHSGGEDPVDQLKFAADQGFTAWEDNGMMGRPTAEQERIAHEMGRLGMKMGVFVAHAEWGQPIYALGGKEARTALQSQMKSAVETAKRVNAKWCTVVPGPFDLRLQWDYQTASVVDCLKAMTEIAEPAELVMVLEPLNPYRDHPGMFLSRIPQAYMICKAVNSQSCKILFDMYHQQITEGNIIPNIDYAWEEVAYFQIGDNPGRCEPTSGEMNYKNIFRHIHQKGFTGILGMEHGNSKPGKDGESALIAAYRQCDDF